MAPTLSMYAHVHMHASYACFISPRQNYRHGPLCECDIYIRLWKILNETKRDASIRNYRDSAQPLAISLKLCTKKYTHKTVAIK